MSSIGRWAYVDDIYLKKYLGWSNAEQDYIYGDPEIIKGYYSDINEAAKDSQGIEFIPLYTVMTEHEGITVADLISYDGISYQQIKKVDFFNSKPFGEEMMDWRIST